MCVVAEACVHDLLLHPKVMAAGLVSQKCNRILMHLLTIFEVVVVLVPVMFVASNRTQQTQIATKHTTLQQQNHQQ
jgi:ABC-type maltose transport system permease subunit